MLGLILVCSIKVFVPVVNDSGKTLFNLESTDILEGVVLATNSDNYLIDFSKDATEKGYKGSDYKKFLVPVQKCFEKK